MNSPLYQDVASILNDAVIQYESSVAGSVTDAWEARSIRSHRSRQLRPITSSQANSYDGTVVGTGSGQSTSTGDAATPSASAGYSSQFSYQVVDSTDHLEPDHMKLKLPCFSVGSRSRKSPFFGRDDVLRSIDKRLLPDSVPSPIEDDDTQISSGGHLKTFAICGAGGIGKTSIALEYAFSRREEYQAIFWVTADGRNVLLEDFARVATELGLQDSCDDLAGACELVKGWLCNPVEDIEAPLDPQNEVSWLLVLDNVDDWSVLEDFWPTTGIGSILMTSRDPLSRSHIYTAKHGLNLEPLNSSESLAFLNVVSQQHLQGNNTAAKAVVEWSGGLPLLMSSMASTMSSQKLTYDTMLDLLKARGFSAIATSSEQQIVSVLGLEHMDSVTKSVANVLSFLYSDDTPKKVVDHLAHGLYNGFPMNQAELDTALTKLEKSSLITFDSSRQAISMHRIYQDIVRESQDSVTRGRILLVTLEIVSRAWVFQPLELRFDAARYATCSEMFPHVDKIFQHYEGLFRFRKIEAHEQAARLFNDAGWYWFERGFPQESKPFCRLAQSICETLKQTAPSETVAEMLRESHNNLGSAANETNQPQESLQHNLMWLALMKERRSANGTEIVDYELGCAYSEVGVAYAYSGMYALAMDHFKLSIRTYESLSNYDSKWLGWPLPNIGLVRWVQGDYDAALIELFKIRDIYDTAFKGQDDGEPFKRGKIYYGIGNVYLSQGDLEHALENHLRCYTYWSKIFDLQHHRIGDICHKLAQDHMGLCNFQAAQEYLNRALGIFARRRYNKHEHTRTMFRQGQLLLASGQPQSAERQFKAAHKQRQSLVEFDSRQWDELVERDYDDLVMFWSR